MAELEGEDTVCLYSWNHLDSGDELLMGKSPISPFPPDRSPSQATPRPHNTPMQAQYTYSDTEMTMYKVPFHSQSLACMYTTFMYMLI